MPGWKTDGKKWGRQTIRLLLATTKCLGISFNREKKIFLKKIPKTILRIKEKQTKILLKLLYRYRQIGKNIIFNIIREIDYLEILLLE